MLVASGATAQRLLIIVLVGVAAAGAVAVIAVCGFADLCTAEPPSPTFRPTFSPTTVPSASPSVAPSVSPTSTPTVLVENLLAGFEEFNTDLPFAGPLLGLRCADVHCQFIRPTAANISASKCFYRDVTVAFPQARSGPFEDRTYSCAWGNEGVLRMLDNRDRFQRNGRIAKWCMKLAPPCRLSAAPLRNAGTEMCNASSEVLVNARLENVTCPAPLSALCYEFTHLCGTLISVPETLPVTTKLLGTSNVFPFGTEGFAVPFTRVNCIGPSCDVRTVVLAWSFCNNFALPATPVGSINGSSVSCGAGEAIYGLFCTTPACTTLQASCAKVAGYCRIRPDVAIVQREGGCLDNELITGITCVFANCSATLVDCGLLEMILEPEVPWTTLTYDDLYG